MLNLRKGSKKDKKVPVESANEFVVTGSKQTTLSFCRLFTM